MFSVWSSQLSHEDDEQDIPFDIDNCISLSFNRVAKKIEKNEKEAWRNRYAYS